MYRLFLLAALALPSVAYGEKPLNPWDILTNRVNAKAQKGRITGPTLEVNAGAAWVPLGAVPQAPSGLGCVSSLTDYPYSKSAWWLFEGASPVALELTATEAAFWTQDPVSYCLVRQVIARRDVLCAPPDLSQAKALTAVAVSFQSDTPEVVTVNGTDLSIDTLTAQHPAAKPAQNALSEIYKATIDGATQGFRVHVDFPGQPTSGMAQPPRTPPGDPLPYPSMMSLAWHRLADGPATLWPSTQTCNHQGLGFDCALAWEVAQTPDGQVYGHFQRASQAGGAERVVVFSSFDKEDSFWRWEPSAKPQAQWRPVFSTLHQGGSVSPPPCAAQENLTRDLLRCERPLDASGLTWRLSVAQENTVTGCESRACPEGKECPEDDCASVVTAYLSEVVEWSIKTDAHTVTLGEVRPDKIETVLSREPCPSETPEEFYE